jgi:hypothetical protein
LYISDLKDSEDEVRVFGGIDFLRFCLGCLELLCLLLRMFGCYFYEEKYFVGGVALRDFWFVRLGGFRWIIHGE